MREADHAALGSKLLDLLDSTAVNSTYKPALMVAITDHVSEMPTANAIPVAELAERVTELYWPQTFDYPETREVLKQNAGGQAKAISEIIRFRRQTGIGSRTIPEDARDGEEWAALIERVELSLAEMPIPRLQKGFEPFLYDFDWPWHDEGGWKKSAYEGTRREIVLADGVAEALAGIAPLIRPFILRWWSTKAFRLNRSIKGAESFDRFESFLFGRSRIPLGRVAADLLGMQQGRCLYCGDRLGRSRHVDHFVPWSLGGSDSLTNLAVACVACNSSKRAILAGPEHLNSLVKRNREWPQDLAIVAATKNWPHDPEGSWRITTRAYLNSPAERHLWIGRDESPTTRPLSGYSDEIRSLLADLD